MAKFDAPRMHSAEHILNQVMVRKFNCGRCFSAHVNKKKSVDANKKGKKRDPDLAAAEVAMKRAT